jgi:hypothetical protein
MAPGLRSLVSKLLFKTFEKGIVIGTYFLIRLLKSTYSSGFGSRPCTSTICSGALPPNLELLSRLIKLLVDTIF